MNEDRNQTEALYLCTVCVILSWCFITDTLIYPEVDLMRGIQANFYRLRSLSPSLLLLLLLRLIRFSHLHSFVMRFSIHSQRTLMLSGKPV